MLFLFSDEDDRLCQPFEQNGREASVDELDLKLLIRRSGGDTPSPPLGSPDGSQLQQEEPMSKEQIIIYGQKRDRSNYYRIIAISAPALISAPPCFWEPIGLIQSFPTVVSD